MNRILSTEELRLRDWEYHRTAHELDEEQAMVLISKALGNPSIAQDLKFNRRVCYSKKGKQSQQDYQGTAVPSCKYLLKKRLTQHLLQ